MKNRGVVEYLVLILKGCTMGAADVVPGVSGGTIAFIAGIYEELIDSIKSINARSLKLLFTFKFGGFFKAINAPFLIAIFMGILISVFSLARVITYLLEFHPIPVWAFFMGLIIASTYTVSREITRWSWDRWFAFVIGGAVAFYITVASPSQTPDSPMFIFLCGAIAICAMILPGISGSFILLLMGKYHYIMDAIKAFDIEVFALFGVGAAIGLILFSNLLSFLLHRYKEQTIALLAGFMVGSLNKVWPWKEQVVERGVELTRNVAPNEQIAPAIALIIVGAAFVLFLDKVSQKRL